MKSIYKKNMNNGTNERRFPKRLILLRTRFNGGGGGGYISFPQNARIKQYRRWRVCADCFLQQQRAREGIIATQGGPLVQRRSTHRE